MGEEAIMSDGSVAITKTLAVVNNVSYPTNTISALSIKEIPASTGWLIWVIVLGVGALIALVNRQFVGALMVAAIVALIIYFRPKVSYSLMVRSAGSDTSVLTNNDASYLGKVKAAIEEAVRQRG